MRPYRIEEVNYILSQISASPVKLLELWSDVSPPDKPRHNFGSLRKLQIYANRQQGGFLLLSLQQCLYLWSSHENNRFLSRANWSPNNSGETSEICISPCTGSSVIESAVGIDALGWFTLSENWKICCCDCYIATRAHSKTVMSFLENYLWWCDCGWQVASLRLNASTSASSTIRSFLPLGLAMDELHQEDSLPNRSTI